MTRTRPATPAQVAAAIAGQMARMADRDPAFRRVDLADMLKSFTVPELVRYLGSEGVRFRSNTDRAEVVATVLDIFTPEVKAAADVIESNDVLTAADASALAAIINAAVTNQKVGRLIEGKVFVGTARSIGDEDGVFLDPRLDIRDGFLRVTLNQGFEAFWPIRDLMPQYLTGEFVVGYEG